MSKYQKTNLFENINEYTIIAPYKYQRVMAKKIQSELEKKSKTGNILTNVDIDFQNFKSGDPNIKVNFDKVKDKDIIFILYLEKNETIFPQLSLINWLRCFVIPDPEQELIDQDANGLKAWKATILKNKYTLGQAKSLTIVIPWYRHCQSERTSRFSFVEEDKYTNLNPDGAFLDIPTAQTFAALLSSQANLPPTTNELITEKIGESKINIEYFPQRVLLIDIHDDLAEMFYPNLGNPNPKPVMEHVLDNFNCWHNDPEKLYDMTTGNGKYFCSVLNHFLKSKQSKSNTFDAVLFPDKGAFLRFKKIVDSNGITNIYYIVKERIDGASKSGPDIYMSDGEKLSPDTELKLNHILIIDDFTNSGSTLFKAKTILDDYITSVTQVSCWISHFVGNYIIPIPADFYSKIESNFTKFYCSDSLPIMTNNLNHEKIEVVSCAPAIVDWITNPNPTTRGGSIKKYKKYKKHRKRTRKQKNHKN